MFKKSICTIILAAMVLSMLSGCGKPTASADSSVPADSSPVSTAEDGSAEPINIHIFGSFWPAERGELTNDFIEQVEKANNVKLELEVPPQSSYNESLQIMMAGGNYPDVVNFSSHSDKLFTQGVDTGLFVPITEQVQKAPDLLAHTYDVTWEAVKTKQDDDIYMIPRTSVARNDGFAIRQDWLDKLNIKISEDLTVTPAEFTDIMKQFTEGDPDGNGKKDTYGFVPSATSDGYLAPFSTGSFGCLGWAESTGEYAYIDPAFEVGNKNFKAALQFTADLWKAGYIHPDWPILKPGDDNTKLFSGEAGSQPVFAGHVSGRELDTKKLNPNAELTYLAGIKNAEGKLIGSTSIPGIWGGWAVTKEAKDVQKVVDTFNWMLSDEGWRLVNYGKEGLTYKMDGDTPVVIPENYPKVKTESWAGIFMRRSDDPNFFLDLSLPQAELDKTAQWIQLSMDTVVFPKDLGFKPAIANDAGFIEAENKRKEVQTKIILGEQPVDNYDQVLEDWYKKGGKTYVEQMNEYISSRK